MIIKPKDIEFSHLDNFKGGERHLEAKMFFDGTNRILTHAVLIPGASIGMHTHDDSCEVIFILEGRGSIIEEDTRKAVEAGDCVFAASLSERTSPTVQVLKLSAEKSKAPVSTATQPIVMIITPIHTESQSSVRIRLEILRLLFIKVGFSLVHHP